jgi:hypothetical protein
MNQRRGGEGEGEKEGGKTRAATPGAEHPLPPALRSPSRNRHDDCHSGLSVAVKKGEGEERKGGRRPELQGSCSRARLWALSPSTPAIAWWRRRGNGGPSHHLALVSETGLHVEFDASRVRASGLTVAKQQPPSLDQERVHKVLDGMDQPSRCLPHRPQRVRQIA